MFYRFTEGAQPFEMSAADGMPSAREHVRFGQSVPFGPHRGKPVAELLGAAAAVHEPKLRVRARIAR
jgi:hypothetical protein